MNSKGARPFLAGEGERAKRGRMRGVARSATAWSRSPEAIALRAIPLIRPSLTRGPPSPARGEGKRVFNLRPTIQGDLSMTSADEVAAAVERRRGDPTSLLQILREAQEALGWISPETVEAVAAQLRIPIVRVQSVLQFYSFLYDKPRGRYRLLFSDNITDRMLGSLDLYEHMLKRLKLKRGEVSPDGLVSVDLTSCTGMCDQGPALLVNNRAVTRLTARRVDEISDLIRARAPLREWPADFFRVDDNIRRADTLLGGSFEPGNALRAAIARGRQGMLDEMKRSNLRGRGGAGFPTGVKWETCRNAPGAEHYVVCNADEGEPGTFKDRVLLKTFAPRVFEGMAIAGFVAGAVRGFLYLRGEYQFLLAPLEAKLEAMRRARLLGSSICGAPGFDFDIEIHLGAGAYVCGEETALIESLEGKPGARASARRSRSPRAIWAGRPSSTTSRRYARRPRSRCAAAPPSPARAPSARPARRFSRSPAIASGRGSTSIPSACASRRCSRTAAPATWRRCRSAALRASA